MFVGGGGGGGVTLTSSRKDWAGFYGCIKQVSNDQSLQWQSLENLTVCLFVCLSVCLSICLSVGLCLSEREREGENSNSKTPFYKDCSPGLVKSSRTSDQFI